MNEEAGYDGRDKESRRVYYRIWDGWEWLASGSDYERYNRERVSDNRNPERWLGPHGLAAYIGSLHFSSFRLGNVVPSSF